MKGMGLFDAVSTLPDAVARRRLAQLVGLDEHKARLTKLLAVLVNPDGLKDWARSRGIGESGLLQDVLRRPPLVVHAGDVGSGKTELAETIGDAVARQEGIEIYLLPLSLSARGQGRVGEMTRLISSAFDYAIEQAECLKSKSGRYRGGVILLVDEADAIAQSREAAQMHHEDRAGVNAFIRGVDRIRNSEVPAAVLMCTNRLTALDPAIRRRAAEILIFRRPDEGLRRRILSQKLSPLGFFGAHIEELVTVTGPLNGRGHGFTFSDLVQRFLPAVVLDAYPTDRIRPERAVEIAKQIVPTPPFQESEA